MCGLAQEPHLDANDEVVDACGGVPPRSNHVRQRRVESPIDTQSAKGDAVDLQLGSWPQARADAQERCAKQVSFEAGMRQTVRWYLEINERMQRAISGEYQSYYEAVYERGWEQSSTWHG